MDNFWSAVGFLSRLPVPPRAHQSPLKTPGVAGWFGVVGLMLGLLAALWGELCVLVLGPWAGAALAVLGWVLLTGALHEDALADVADAFFATRDRARLLAIMKDSRIGAYGGVALVMVLLLRVTCVAELSRLGPPGGLAAATVAAWGLSRAWAVWLMGALKAVPSAPLAYGAGAGPGLGRSYSLALSPRHVAAALVSATAGAWLLARWLMGDGAVVALAGSGSFVCVLLLRGWYYRRLGGFTGDCLGAGVLLGETSALLVVLAVFKWFGE